MPALSPPTADRPRRVTITQVAEASGVARATAAFVISGRAPELRISPKTIERVQAVAKRLGYVPNNLARGMITGRSHVVGVILGGVWGKFGQYAIEGIRGVLDAHGYLPFLTIHSWSEDREQRELDMLMRMRVDGVIAMPQLMSRKDCYTSLTKQRVPEDVRIACIGDTIETVEQSAQLTAIREPVREIGRVAAELVIEAIKNPKLRPQERLVDSAELVVRPWTVGMADGPR